MGISVIRASDTGTLALELAGRFATAGRDPFASEMVVVPTRGIERYLTQTIADRAGICANIDFPSPRELLERASGGNDAWHPDRLVWPLLAAIDASLGQPWAQPLAEHLRDEPDQPRSDRRFALAHRLAALFDAYAMERPAMVRRWNAGEPSDVPEDLIWQYQLWRELRGAMPCGPLESETESAGLPDRISVFGPTRLPQRLLDVLQALAAHREVDVYLPVASPALWDAPSWLAATARAEDTSRALALHPLLRSLGRDTRELRQRLGPAGRTLHPVERAPDTVLGRLQSQIAANSASDLAGQPLDDSLQVHACHGPLRQVDVLLEVLLSLLHNDPTLQPRDIVIMTPDLELYAPLLAAVFAGPAARVRDLRLAIADRTPEQHNEVLVALAATLAVLAGRMRRSEVLDLLAREPVRRRVGLSVDDVVRVEELAEAAQVRWGLDAEHRRALGAGDADLGTWSWGLDRMALGSAMTDEPLTVIGNTLPLPDLGSGDVGPVGRFAAFVERLAGLREQVRRRRSLVAWNDLLQQLISDLTALPPADAWQEAQARSAVAAFVANAGGLADQVQLSLADLRHMLSSVLTGRPTRAGFRLGGITACQLEPMRSVPHRVVALLGMDDDAFPRASGHDGDDVLLRDPRIGERDPRSEDRQLLLDAVMAAREHLVITYTGRDRRTNEPRQPAVPIAELLDLLPAQPAPVRHHPLQPFDPRNFDAATPFSHDEAALAGARALVGPREAGPPPLAALPALPPEAAPTVEPPTIDELVRFLKDPLTDFLRRRLALHLDRSAEPPAERLPVNLSGLQAWVVGDGLLRVAAAAGAAEALTRAAAAGGTVPPGELGAECLAEVRTQAHTIHDKAAKDRSRGPGRSLEVPVPWLPDGVVLITDIHNDTVVRTTYSNKGPKQLLEMWPTLLCLRLAQPDVPWRSYCFTRTAGWYLTSPDPVQCRADLDVLLDLYRRAATSLLPVTPKTSHEYARALLGKDGQIQPGQRDLALRRARGAWRSYQNGDNCSPAARLIFGPDSEFDLLLAAPPGVDECWFGTEARSRFEAVSLRVWSPILQHVHSRRPARKPAKVATRTRAARRKGSR